MHAKYEMMDFSHIFPFTYNDITFIVTKSIVIINI